VDLGYLVNAGFSYKWGTNVDTDNQFSVKVLVQMADTFTTNTGTSIYFSVKIGDIIVVGESMF
jgi:hypothetical protein